MSNVSLQQDPLSLWTKGAVKESILNFLFDVTDESSEFFVPASDRIAVFDNDGTLWCEKPLLTQLAFIKEQLLNHPDKTHLSEHESVFKRFQDEIEVAAEHLAADVAELTNHLLGGVSVQQYSQQVVDWIQHAQHPRFHCLYTELHYAPMLEVLALFKAHQFECFIVSGGSTDFVRPWCEPVYNIPKQNIIGSSMRTHLVEKSGLLHLDYLPVPFYFDDGAAKVKSIARLIGKQPIAAFGNSSGDVQMLRWTKQAKRSVACLVHHTDAVREYRYSPDSLFHKGPKTLTLAEENDWCIIDMAKDWQQVFS